MASSEEEIDRAMLKKYEILAKLGKGVSVHSWTAVGTQQDFRWYSCDAAGESCGQTLPFRLFPGVWRGVEGAGPQDQGDSGLKKDLRRIPECH